MWRQSTPISFALYKSRRRYAINNFIFAYAIELALYRTQTLIWYAVEKCIKIIIYSLSLFRNWVIWMLQLTQAKIVIIRYSKP